jgi:hypothetical protein
LAMTEPGNRTPKTERVNLDGPTRRAASPHFL